MRHLWNDKSRQLSHIQSDTFVKYAHIVKVNKASPNIGAMSWIKMHEIYSTAVWLLLSPIRTPLLILDVFWWIEYISAWHRVLPTAEQNR